MPAIDLLTLAELPDADHPAWSDWLTAAELTACRGYLRGQEHLAARLAGKLAVAREAGIGATPWHALEISQGHQRPPMVLANAALADLLGPDPVPAVSLTHAGGYVAALAWHPCAAEDAGDVTSWPW